MSLNGWTKARVLAFDAAMRPWAGRGRLNGWAYEFLLFGLKQAWACLFGGAMSILLFAPTWVVFTPNRTPRRMPILAGFLLVALFIWIAENVGAFTSAWRYPSQHDGWTIVPIGKLGAWCLLMLLSFVLVALVHRPRAPGQGEATNPVASPNPVIPDGHRPIRDPGAVARLEPLAPGSPLRCGRDDGVW